MSKEHQTEVIATSFIKQYYEMMSQNPAELYKFYGDHSRFNHSENLQPTQTVFGKDNIREMLSHLNLPGVSVDVSSLEAQQSENNGILVVVTGQYTHWQQEPRQFIQTFFLAHQIVANTKAATYNVSNSIFRLVGFPPVLRHPHFGNNPAAEAAYYAAAAAHAAHLAGAGNFGQPGPPPMFDPMHGYPHPPLTVHHPEYGANGVFQHGPAPTMSPPRYLPTVEPSVHEIPVLTPILEDATAEGGEVSDTTPVPLADEEVHAFKAISSSPSTPPPALIEVVNVAAVVTPVVVEEVKEVAVSTETKTSSEVTTTSTTTSSVASSVLATLTSSTAASSTASHHQQQSLESEADGNSCSKSYSDIVKKMKLASANNVAVGSSALPPGLSKTATKPAAAPKIIVVDNKTQGSANTSKKAKENKSKQHPASPKQQLSKAPQTSSVVDFDVVESGVVTEAAIKGLGGKTSSANSSTNSLPTVASNATAKTAFSTTAVKGASPTSLPDTTTPPSNTTTSSSQITPLEGPDPNRPFYTLYITGLPQGTLSSELRALFSSFGPLRAIDLPAGKSYAFVKYEDHSSLKTALSSGASLIVRGKLLTAQERIVAKDTGVITMISSEGEKEIIQPTQTTSYQGRNYNNHHNSNNNANRIKHNNFNNNTSSKAFNKAPGGAATTTSSETK